ncbi:MAG: hypothetical protein ACR2Q4_11230 [Geminicoccaceae bacterium]
MADLSAPNDFFSINNLDLIETYEPLVDQAPAASWHLRRNTKIVDGEAIALGHPTKISEPSLQVMP